ncbi:MAG TPA: aminotransferase class IV [Puia sp.]|uniref:aminotransferase class IV n=1 Tax=Puia sp. TaxID=2045100 RepID=UPI002CB8DD2E|nr:aminotransferase class IV [Puia sp.]HVU93790.1 aminotransferase class IV [Puia sp.]
MNSPAWIDHNGALLPSNSGIINAANRAFHYGDGLFETLMVRNGRIRLRDAHFDRLFAGMNLLRYVIPRQFTRESLEASLLQLCDRNGHLSLARVRLTIYRGDGGLYDPEDLHPRYLIESWPLGPADIDWNEKGLAIDIYPDGIKSCDLLANVKSNNFLLYALAALYARECGLDDCLVRNSHERLADSTIANLFFCKNRQVYTPPLSEGCVAGVMRRFLLSQLPGAGILVHEHPVTAEDLLDADEVFLSNAIRGIRWVQTFRKSRYGCDLSRTIHHQLIKALL